MLKNSGNYLITKTETMENTLIDKMVKKRIFSMHYDGQIVMRHEGWNEKFPNDYVSFNCIMDKGFYLELTPLSQITDEDATYLAKIENDFENPVDRGRFLAVQIKTSFFSIRSELFIQMIDYLRSKGYALPWLDTTVEQQVEFGWVKLKTLKQ